MYLYCAMTDLAIEINDKSLLLACKNIWHDLVTKKMHVTGGIGPNCANEGFTCNYDLPNESAYLETCAAIGLFLWAYRMFNAAPDSKYTYVMELALYNGIASGVSLDGTKFLYGNPLATYPGFDGNGRYQGGNYHYRRSEWFDCACCPPNIARLYANLPAFIYSASDDSIFTHLYTSSQAKIKLKNSNLRISQKTNYPWDGKISLRVETEMDAVFNLLLRVPDWCNGKFKLSINEKKTICEIRNGYAKITRKWSSGDSVELDLKMPIRLLSSHPSARQNCGKIAIQRGPLIYCIEEADNGKDLNDIAILRNSQFRESREKSLGGYISLSTRAFRSDKSAWKNKLYSEKEAKCISFTLKAIPYFLWGNRKKGEMLTWIRTI